MDAAAAVGVVKAGASSATGKTKGETAEMAKQDLQTEIDQLAEIACIGRRAFRQQCCAIATYSG
jgi:hypothetical protein